MRLAERRAGGRADGFRGRASVRLLVQSSLRIPNPVSREERLSQELSFSGRLKRALVAATARTSADAADARLVGRTYAIPFRRVWNGALDLVRGELRRWHARWWDEEAGVIQALHKGRFSRRTSDVVVRIRLDEEGQTRVDLRSTSRSGRVGDLGSNTRLIGAFVTALDRKLAGPPSPPRPKSAQAADRDRAPESGTPRVDAGAVAASARPDEVG